MNRTPLPGTAAGAPQMDPDRIGAALNGPVCVAAASRGVALALPTPRQCLKATSHLLIICTVYKLAGTLAFT